MKQPKDLTPMTPESAVAPKKFFNLNWKNKWLMAVSIAVVAIVVALVAALLWVKSPTFGKLGVDVVQTEGGVQYRRSADAQWQAATKDLSLSEGAQVRTADNARIVLNIDDGSVIRLNANSSVALNKLLPGHIVVQNTGGQVYTRVKKSATRVFEVKVNKTTYRSQGTSYRTHNTDKLEGIEAYHGKVKILGLNPGGDVVVGQGQRYFVIDRDHPDAAGKLSEIPIAEIAADSFMVWNAEEDRKKFSHELGVLFDLKPPPLEISAPAADATIDASSTIVKGTTETGAKVLVNGTEVANNNGAFEGSVELNVGDNTITVEVTDSPGNKTVKTFNVKRITPTPQSVTSTPKKSKTTTPSPVTPDPAPTGSLTLAHAGAKNFTWSNTGTALYGYRLVYSTNPNPVYSHAALITYNKDATSGTILAGPGTWYVRVCMYYNNDCAIYSNEVSIVVP